MDNRRRSQDRRRPSGNLQIESESQDFEQVSDSSSKNNQFPKHSRETESPLETPKFKYTNIKSTLNSNRSKFNDDSDNDEISDEIPATKQVRGGFVDSKRSNENSPHRINIKDALAKSPEILPKRDKRRKSKRRKWREDNSIPTAKDNNEKNPDEDRYPIKSRRLSSSSKKESSDDVHRSKKKKSRSRGGGSDNNELPITEILRKAQENSRIQYEEPSPLPQLTTDTIYVQGRNGFSAFKIPVDHRTRRNRNPVTSKTITYPIKIAIFAQKAWKSMGFIFQGLLAGMSLMHFIFLQTYFKDFKETLTDYSLLSEIYSTIFSFLIAMSIVSAFDKYDLAHLNLDHFREIYDRHAKSILAVILYISVFCLHQATLKVNDKFSLLHYRTNETTFSNATDNSSISQGDLNTWHTLTLTKDGITVLAWLFISLGPQNDMLLTHLQSLEKYVDDAN